MLLNKFISLIFALLYIFNFGIIKSNEFIYDIQDSFLLSKKFEKNLYILLIRADQDNIPKKIVRKDGSIYYKYKRSKYQPKLSVEQIEDLLKKKNHSLFYRNYIRNTLSELRIRGVDIMLRKNSSKETTANWNPYEKLIQIDINAIALGSKSFAEILNHEVIHVAQSCKNGSINSYPTLLGINSIVPKESLIHLNSHIYRNISKHEKTLELEAYSNQKNLKLGIQLLRRLCNP